MHTMKSTERLFIIVRHGERLDETDRGAWRAMKTTTNQHDPPLTKQGATQARQAGIELSGYLQRLGQLAALSGEAAPPAPRVYSSPTERTMATATELCSTLVTGAAHPLDVTAHYGLNCCAAAKRYGVQSEGFTCNANPGGPPKATTAPASSQASVPVEQPQDSSVPPVEQPQGDPSFADARNQGASGGFVQTCVDLAGSGGTKRFAKGPDGTRGFSAAAGRGGECAASSSSSKASPLNTACATACATD